MKIDIADSVGNELLKSFPEGFTVEQCVNMLVSASAGQTPKKDEWWFCHLKQGCVTRFTVILKATEDYWSLPEERLNHTWRQEDVIPLSKAVVISDVYK